MTEQGLWQKLNNIQKNIVSKTISKMGPEAAKLRNNYLYEGDLGRKNALL